MNVSGLSNITLLNPSGSTYWLKKDSEKANIFRKIEPYLTFLDVHQLERQGARHTNEGRRIVRIKSVSKTAR